MMLLPVVGLEITEAERDPRVQRTPDKERPILQLGAILHQKHTIKMLAGQKSKGINWARKCGPDAVASIVDHTS